MPTFDDDGEARESVDISIGDVADVATILPHDAPDAPKVGEDNLHEVFGHAEGEVKGPDPTQWGEASAQMFDLRQQMDAIEQQHLAEQAAKSEQPPEG